MVDRARLAHIVSREAIFLVLSLAVAVVFLNHQILYLNGGTPTRFPLLAYAISTILVYGFVRGIVFVGAMRMPRVAADPSRCPECGQPLEHWRTTDGRHPRQSPPQAARVARPIPVGPPAQPSPTVTTSGDPIPGIGPVVNPAVEAQLLRELADSVRQWAIAPPPASGAHQRPPSRLREAR